MTASLEGHFQNTTAFSPTSGYSGTSATFYGGGAVVRENELTNDGFSSLEIKNQGPSDSIQFKVDTGQDKHTFSLLHYWDKVDFLNGLDSQSDLTLDSMGAFSLTVQQSSGNQADERLRWVVRNGSEFYVSEFNALLTNNTTFNSAYSTLINWAAYNPIDPGPGPVTGADLMSLNFDQSSSFAPVTFDDVTGLGFLH